MNNSSSYFSNKQHLYHFKQRNILIVLFLLLFLLLLVGCKKEPIKIGFIGDLSSKNSQLAIDGRNAVELSVRKLNEAGGIDGRDLILVVKDDKASTEVAIQMHQEFINEDVHFIIGHMHSNMKDAMLTSASEDLLFISPTIASNSLSYLDDYILRTSPLTSAQGDLFYNYSQDHQLKELVIVYDLMNKEYSETLTNEIQRKAELDNYPIKGIISYDSRTDDLSNVLKEIDEVQPKNLLIIAQGTDTAFLIQGIKQKDASVNMYSVSWSMTNDFITRGGHSAEGTKFIGVFSPEMPTELYLEFESEFINTYSYNPSFVCALAADAFNVLTEGLINTEELSPISVKQSILKIKNFNGLMQEFSIDEYGDNDMGYMFYELIDGVFVPIR